MEQDQISIQRATPADAAEIWRIQIAAFKGQAKIYNNYDLPPLKQTLASMQAEFADKVILKAVMNGRIVGSVRYVFDDKEVEVERLIVDPQYQGRGIGTLLMKHLENEVDPEYPLKLFTGSKSVRNLHVYEKLGYREYDRSRTPFGVELVHMRKVRK